MKRRLYYLKVFYLQYKKQLTCGLLLLCLGTVGVVYFLPKKPPTTPAELTLALNEGKELFKAKRYLEAYRLLIYPAQHNYIQADLILGKMYYDALGVDKDLKKAYEHFKKASNTLIEGKYMVAQMGFRGEIKGMKKGLAVTLLTTAAYGGFVPAQRDMGLYLLLSQEYDQAYFWLSLASKQSDLRATQALKKATTFVSEYERSLLDAEVNGFVPRKG